MSPDELVDAALRAELDGLAVTDHDTQANVGAVVAAAPPELDIIPGVELSTTAGHLLALGLEEVPSPDNPLSVVEHVHSAGGVAVLSHPFDTFREHYTTDLAALAATVDGVETVNSRCLRASFNRRATAFAAEHGLAVTGGSDAHFPSEVGRATTVVPDSPIEGIRAGTTAARGRGRYLSGHAATKLHEYAPDRVAELVRTLLPLV
jgi:predicted metal-dependent phosphoesterase TrpH